ncbi:Cro/Cl family transcriptional regulator [Rahnella aceris]
MEAQTLGEVIKTIRVPVVAIACGVSARAIYKWIDRGSLPRTDFTGETTYAQKISTVRQQLTEILHLSVLCRRRRPPPTRHWPT